MVSTAIIASSVATSSAIMALNEQRQEKAECMIYIDNFNSKLSTTTEKRHYSDCVHKVYGDANSATDIFLIKIAIIIGILSIVISSVISLKTADDYVDLLLSFLCFSLASFLGLSFIASIPYGIYYLFT